MFGSKCWAKIPTEKGGSKLDPQSVECWLLGYTSGSGNYQVQEVISRRVFVLQDVVFEEGQPHCTSADVGEETLFTFEANIVPSDDKVPSADNGGNEQVPDRPSITDRPTINLPDNQYNTPVEP